MDMTSAKYALSWAALAILLALMWFLLTGKVDWQDHGPILAGILRGLASSFGAVALAVLALRPRRTVWAQQGITQAIGRTLRGLRQLHSGRAGDYVTWLTMGVATFGLFFGQLLR